MTTILITQARMNSSRLPGKVLRTVLGKTLLEYHLERLVRASGVNLVVVATTDKSMDDPIAELSRSLGVALFRGDEDDVLSRFHGAAVKFKADTVVRVTSDCPLIDPEIVQDLVERFKLKDGSIDFVSNTILRSYPRGMDCEVFSFAALDEAHRNGKSEGERAHVTPYIYSNPSRFRLEQMSQDIDQSSHRWVVDTIEDFTFIEKVLTAIYPSRPHFTQHDVIALLERHPDWVSINAHIEQKKWDQGEARSPSAK